MLSSVLEFVDGWYPEERDGVQPFRWTSERAVCRLSNATSEEPRFLRIRGGHFFPDRQSPRMDVSIDTEPVGSREVKYEVNDYLFPLPKSAGPTVDVTIQLDRSFDVSSTGDGRRLGMIVRALEVLPESALGCYREGWYAREKEGSPSSFRWMSREAECVFHGLPRGQRVTLSLRCAYPFDTASVPSLSVFVNDARVGRREVPKGEETLYLPFKARSETARVRLSLDRAIDPSISGDPRELGLAVRAVEATPETSAPFPLNLELETTTYCNINPPCVMCVERVFNIQGVLENRQLFEPVLQQLLPHLGRFQSISLHGIGEPLATKRVPEILDSVDVLRTDVQFNSNGLLLNEEKARMLVEKGLAAIDFSLDAATSETFKKIRRRPDFDRVISNIRRLSEVKREAGSSRPLVKLNMTLMKENLGEVLPFLDLARGVDAQIVHFGLLNPWRPYEVDTGDFVFSYTDQMLDATSPEFVETMGRARDRARELGLECSIEIPPRAVGN